MSNPLHPTAALGQWRLFPAGPGWAIPCTDRELALLLSERSGRSRQIATSSRFLCSRDEGMHCIHGRLAELLVSLSARLVQIQ